MNQLEKDFTNYVLEIADDNPDYQYSPEAGNGCHYTRGYGPKELESPNPGCTGCLLGRAMQKLGADKEWLSRNGSYFNDEYADELAIHLHSKGLYIGQEISPTLARELRQAQSLQDKGTVWGQCVDALRVFVQ